MSAVLLGQNTKQQKELQARKKALLQQIQQMNSLRVEQAQERKSVLSSMQEIDQKIQAQTELIRITNQQANLIDAQIKQNTQEIEQLQKELAQLRKEYANIVRQSYKSRSGQSQLMFLLSSESFAQGFKRIKYMKQYSQFRKKQSTEIARKNQQLAQINDTLSFQKKEKEQILEQNKEVKNQLSQEREKFQQLAASIRDKEHLYEKQIREKQAQAQLIDKEIERIVALSITEANQKNSQKTVASSLKNASTQNHSATVQGKAFELTPEGKNIASSFQANKGKLIWPVQKGYKSQGFGTYSDPIYPNLKHNNSGISIVAPKGSEARSVFDGEVSAIISVPGGNKAVQVRHGNYITIYYNLSQVYVTKGQRVFTKSPLGKIFTDSEGKTEMKFFVYKNTTKLNPEYWVRRM